MPDTTKLKVALTGVPETLLWNLYQRATEARRPDAVIADPKAIEVVDSLDYPFEERFGRAKQGQWQALRALRFDMEVRSFLAEHPDGQVVALGEGLETQFWRVDNGRVHWLSVDLPETVAVRKRILPSASARQVTVAADVLDEEWMARTDPARAVLLSAQGLLMYFQQEQVHRLIAGCARRFPGARMVFDGVPKWFSDKTVKGEMKTAGYRSPPMPWYVDAAEKDRLRAIPNVAALHDLSAARGRGLMYGYIFPVINRLRAVRELGISGLPIMAIDFGTEATDAGV
jgi:O-methyltransferase involved in polyketide biosynthesis